MHEGTTEPVNSQHHLNCNVAILTSHLFHLVAAPPEQTRPEIVSSLGLNGTTGFMSEC